MFHCNGWGYPWTIAALAGSAVCCRYVVAKDIYDLIVDHNITHFGGAPVVLNFLANAPDNEKRKIDHADSNVMPDQISRVPVLTIFWLISQNFHSSGAI